MVPIATHLSDAELELEYLACRDARRSRHLQTIRLLAKGHSVTEVSAITAFRRAVDRAVTGSLQRRGALRAG